MLEVSSNFEMDVRVICEAESASLLSIPVIMDTYTRVFVWWIIHAIYLSRVPTNVYELKIPLHY